jgi:hypothetical protein
VVDYRWGDDLLAFIEDVPAGVCEVCGEQELNTVPDVIRVVLDLLLAQSRTRSATRAQRRHDRPYERES